MRSVFPGYYGLIAEEIARLWERCVFVLDANMLLNLYRYPPQARDDLLEILDSVSDRLWVPHQAALEYHANRLAVIAEQVVRYGEVQRVLDEAVNGLKGKLGKLQLKKRHSAIDPDGLIRQVEAAVAEFTQGLQVLEQQQPKVSDRDVIRDKLDALLEGRVGPALESRKDLDAIVSEGRERYGQKRPPGYLDAGKKGSEGVHVAGELAIPQLYGDLILWKQTLRYTQTQHVDSLVLVTDERGEDWWWKIDCKGEKTIGPRPELIEEMRSEGGVSLFHMYNSERFMTFAKKHLDIQVRSESIEQVRSVALASSQTNLRRYLGRGQLSEQAFINWLTSVFPDDEITESYHEFPDVVRTDHRSGERIGYELKYTRDVRLNIRRILDTMYQGYYQVSEGRLDAYVGVLILESGDEFQRAYDIFRRRDYQPPPGTSLLVGQLVAGEDGSEAEFIWRLDLRP